MTTRVNYDDNIFFLQQLISTLESGVQLTIDGDLFRDKMVEDLLFIDGTLSRILAQLRENRLLIRRGEYLRALMRAEKLFVELLDKCVDENLPFAAELTDVAHKLRVARGSHQRHLEEIRSLLHATAEAETDEDVVSQEEFRSLLQDDVDADGEAGSDVGETDSG
jgi:hypothetical protein